MKAFWYQGSDPIPEFGETMEQYHQRVLASREANEVEWQRRYFVKYGEYATAAATAKRRAAQTSFDAREHRMIDLVTGEPRGKLRPK